ncbi:OmpA/MotB domain protein [Chloroherpeton thalassium ATCC 35110]|uniref:OmpA/MotB domain protein n=1 Tax=Chloroherpeton thalassium (strain ATCC 35110 / GB-78) TaxID=517418 RepID=B3QXR4_CHLT3|nr:OmpA family protein [Chloroherpeton thalassium]ACF14979.1 OmpA/MotB domain protein [Chloroherpeton thalassium ATCC 35110]
MAQKYVLPLLLLVLIVGSGCASDPTISMFVRQEGEELFPRKKRVEMTIGDSAVIGWKAENIEEIQISNLFSTRRVEKKSEDSTFVSPRPALPGPKKLTYQYIAIATAGEKSVKDTVQVLVSVPAPPQITFSVSPEKIVSTKSDKATISWTVKGALPGKITISGIGQVDSVGKTEVKPQESMQYVITAEGKGGTSKKASTLIVEVPELSNILFAYDRANIDASAQAQFQKNQDSLKTLLDDPDINIVIEGHCDVRGDNSYNYELGAKRANNAWLQLVERFNLSDEYRRFKVVSFGKAKANYKPRVPEPYPTNDSQYQPDRNVTFVPLKKGRRVDNDARYSSAGGSGYKTAPRNPRYMSHKD